MAKIAILYEVLGRSKGGIEAWIYHASEELLRQGHDVSLVNTQGDQTPEDAAPSGVTLISLDRKGLVPSLFLIRSTFNTKYQLDELLKGYDHVWARSFSMAWAASKVIESSKVIYINAAPYSYYAYRPFLFHIRKASRILDVFYAIAFQLSYMAAWFFEKNAIRNCVNVFLSEKRKDQTLDFFRLKDKNEQFYVVPPGVNCIKFAPRDRREPVLASLRIISVCRLEEAKNIQCVLHAVSVLVKEGVEIAYTIVGDGSYRPELENLRKVLDLESSVFFVGMQENIEKWYSKNDVFVLPSLYEGFGSVYIEAMASSLVCIAISNKSGKFNVASDEIIDHGVNGFLLKDSDPQELARYLKDLSAQPELIEEMGKNARLKALTNFSWENAINELLNIPKY